ncbi:hypothetical protein [Streptomyces sp. NBC_01803]|uniref:hypothetical protein n=1 Tax=Streptomyces sp. NBC_01803 TaxID=2975946 RepID=UPI002DDA1920|nr:hypothetical protein [Streptomyces sp. NBC_01803]WSA45959.1 hypothetical protein OIE51_18185 [Streptomyces sp. NBC_01803]
MDLRDSKSRLILIVVALGAALVVAVASCGGGGGDDGGGDGTSSAPAEQTDGGDTEEDGASEEDPSSEDPAGQETLAEVTGEEDITLTITRAEREAGGFLTIEGTIHNGSSESWGTSTWAGEESELAGNDFSMAGATLTAHEEQKRYLILRDTEGRCLCTNFGLQIDAGVTETWFAQFPEPDAGTTEVDFQIGQMPPATIEIH